MPAYTENIRAAIDWALNTDRAAWSRTLAAVQANADQYRIEDVEAAGQRIRQTFDANLANWLEAMRREAQGPAHVPELQQPAETIWQHIVCLNCGIFATTAAKELFLPFLVTIASTKPGNGPLYLSPNLDGWGVMPASDS